MNKFSHFKLRQLFREYFESRKHIWLPSASLLPENDSSVLFITAGMHPLEPYLMGQTHPEGKRLASIQKCIRTGDLDEVGDSTHHTFFEMLGNWSLGDYFKKEAISWSLEFLTDKKWLGLDRNMLAMSVFAGDNDAAFDQESFDLWKDCGISEKRIAKLPRKDNWWGPAGQVGPCGPDTEIFYWRDASKPPAFFDPKDERWVEVWNNVFMQYDLRQDKRFYRLNQQNVDTGMGMARILSVLNGYDDNYRTDIFWPTIETISEITGEKYEDQTREFRIIADHTTAAVMAMSDGVAPSNKGEGFVVRRLIRRALVTLYLINGRPPQGMLEKVYRAVAKIYEQVYPTINNPEIQRLIIEEEIRYLSLLIGGVKKVSEKNINGEQLFNLYQSHGLSPEIVLDVLHKRGVIVEETDRKKLLKDFQDRLQEHQELSRTASVGMFRGGLVDNGEISKRYHTATHLLQAALRSILGDDVRQRGSNINADRMRFDFSYSSKIPDDQLKLVEDLVNEQIKKDLPVNVEEMLVSDAKKSGALGIFDNKYGERVTVYTIGDFSKEICGGPHVNHTSEIGNFKIVKEEASSAGVRRIKAVIS